MQFQVPQFIETEDKIVGPFTLRQFLYIAGGGVASFVLFFILRPWLWLVITLFLGSISVVMAFIKINGRPMSVFIPATFNYIWSPRIYTLKPKVQEQHIETEAISRTKKGSVFTGIKSLLEKMATSKNAIPKREQTIAAGNFDIPQREIKERYEVIRRITGDRQMARRIDYR